MPLGWGKKQNKANHQGGLPKFVKDDRNAKARRAEEERKRKNAKKKKGDDI